MMKVDLNGIATKTDASKDLMLDLKVDHNTTMDGMLVAKQNAAALKCEFNSLLDKMSISNISLTSSLIMVKKLPKEYAKPSNG